MVQVTSLGYSSLAFIISSDLLEDRTNPMPILVAGFTNVLWAPTGNQCETKLSVNIVPVGEKALNLKRVDWSCVNYW